MTGNDLITSTLRLIGAISAEETPSAAEANDALAVLNQLIDQWNAERMMIFTITINEFPLTVGQQVYTLGPGGNFNMPRPAKIPRMSIVSLLNPAQPLELPIEMLTEQQWQEEIPVKLIQSTLPLQCYDDGAFPFRNLNFRYIPTIPVNVRIYAWQALSQFVDLVTDYTFPPGYIKAIRYNLALDLAPEYERPLNPEITAQAATSKGIIKSMNTVIVDLKCDTALIGDMTSKRLYNWLVDMPVAR